MRRLLSLCGALALSGCATAQRGIEVRTVEVPVLRVETCIDEADIPRRPGPLPRRPASAVAALDIAIAKLLEWTSYGEKADALLKGCAADVKPVQR